MGQAVVTLPDGKRARVTFDSQEQLDATVTDLVSQHGGTPKREPPEMGFHGDPVSRGLGEAAVSAVTGTAAAAAGGVAGLARGAGAGAAALASGQGAGKALDAFTEEASDTIQRVEQAGTYQPRSVAGKRAKAIVESPFTLLKKGADVAGDVTSRGVKGAATALGASPETATRLGAGAGALVNTGIQAIPGAVAPVARAVRGKVAPRVAPEQSASGPASTPPPVGNTGPAPRGTPEVTTPGGGPGTGTQAKPEGPGRAPEPPQQTPGPGTAQPQSAQGATVSPEEQRAQAYARSIGLDWSNLGTGVRSALSTIAKDATALERLDPRAVERQAVLGSLRVPVRGSRGQLTNDPVELRREAIASRTEAGRPIQEIDTAANRDLQANLEVLRGRVGGMRGGMHDPTTEEGRAQGPSIREATKAPTRVGEAAQEAAREKAKWSKKGYQALYKIARETEPDVQVPLTPVTDLLTQNPEIQHMGWVQSWLNKAARTKAPEGGEPVQMTEAKLAELHDLRSTANDIARTGGKEGYYAGQVVKAIDQAMEGAPQGAAAWKKANEAFRKHQQEFKDQGAVGKLVNQKKGGADRALALEKTWKTIATGPLESLRQVKKTLLTGGTPATRMGGRRAWRDIRAETVNRILEDARNVSSTDPAERRVLTAVALKRSMDRIPRENLEEILGQRNVRELYQILRAREITRGRTTESGTVPNALVLFEKALKHIPFGKYAVGAKHAIQKVGEAGEAARTAKEAQVSPLEQAARDVERVSKRRSARAALETLERGGPTLPASPPPQPSIGDALKRPTP